VRRRRRPGLQVRPAREDNAEREGFESSIPGYPADACRSTPDDRLASIGGWRAAGGARLPTTSSHSIRLLKAPHRVEDWSDPNAGETSAMRDLVILPQERERTP
jgi:hypothetical protein